MSDKHKIALWKNEKKNKESHPDMTGEAACPCCNESLRVAVWVQPVDPNSPKRPRLSGELEPAKPKNEERKSSSNDLLDEVLEEVGTVEQVEAKTTVVTDDSIPF